MTALIAALAGLALAQLVVAALLLSRLRRARRDLTQRDQWLAGYRLTVTRLAGRLVAWRFDDGDVARWEQEWL